MTDTGFPTTAIYKDSPMQHLAKNVETLIKVSVHLGVVHTEVVQACENFLWETDEIPLAKRLQIADWYLLTDLFVCPFYFADQGDT